MEGEDEAASSNPVGAKVVGETSVETVTVDRGVIETTTVEGVGA